MTALERVERDGMTLAVQQADGTWTDVRGVTSVRASAATHSQGGAVDVGPWRRGGWPEVRGIAIKVDDVPPDALAWMASATPQPRRDPAKRKARRTARASRRANR